jgi:hypothetical protein
MALGKSITLTRTGKIIGDGSSLTNLPLTSYSTTAQINLLISTSESNSGRREVSADPLLNQRSSRV